MPRITTKTNYHSPQPETNIGIAYHNMQPEQTYMQEKRKRPMKRCTCRKVADTLQQCSSNLLTPDFKAPKSGTNRYKEENALNLAINLMFILLVIESCTVCLQKVHQAIFLYHMSPLIRLVDSWRIKSRIAPCPQRYLH